MKRPGTRTTLTFLMVVGVAALIAGSSLTKLINGVSKPGAPPNPDVVEVLKVIDGDTIRVRYISGNAGLVRYIGINTPELRRRGRKAACFAREAKAHNTRLVGGKQVRIVQDRQRRDRFGRVLAYVYRMDDGLFVNGDLVRRGYARKLTVPPNTTHVGDFTVLSGLAKAEGAGLWSACEH